MTGSRARFTAAIVSALEGGAALERVSSALLAHRADTRVRLDAALRANGARARSHALAGLLEVLSGEAARLEVARAHLASAQQSAREPHAGALVAALRACCAGDKERGAEILDAGTRPRSEDVLLVKLSHALRFMSGAQRAMRTSLARALPGFAPDDRYRGYLHGMYAFALEETGALDEAQRHAERALTLTPDDVWGAHALVHVHLARGDMRRGAAFLDALPIDLATKNNFGAHMVWHRALFHLAAGEHTEALALYDTRIVTTHLDFRDAVNATSLLFHLERRGHDVGDRWSLLADRAWSRLGDHGLAFADVHHVLALARAGRLAEARHFAESIRAVADRSPLHAEVALPVVRVLLGERTSTPELHEALLRLGGSHVQRAVLHALLDPTRDALLIPFPSSHGAEGAGGS